MDRACEVALALAALEGSSAGVPSISADFSAARHHKPCLSHSSLTCDCAIQLQAGLQLGAWPRFPKPLQADLQSCSTRDITVFGRVTCIGAMSKCADTLKSLEHSDLSHCIGQLCDTRASRFIHSFLLNTCAGQAQQTQQGTYRSNQLSPSSSEGKAPHSQTERSM